MILAGRSGLDALVEQCRGRPPEAGGAALPILVLLGPVGSGKSAALTRVRQATEDLPVGFLDVARRGYATAAEIMMALVLQFATFDGPEGSLSFPRFLAGHLTSRLSLADDDPRGRERAVRSLLDGLHARRIPEDVRTIIREATTMLGPVAGLQVNAGDLAVTIVESARHRLRRTPALSWWQSRTRPGVGELVELHRKVNEGTPDERRTASSRLCEAFFADLRACYAGTRMLRPRTKRSVALLDNVDTEAGLDLLELVAEVRDRVEPEADPLLIVAGCGSDNARLRCPPVAVSDRLDLSAWRAGLQPGVPESRFYTLRMRDLTKSEVDHVAADRGVSNRRWVAVTHGVTAGYPAGVAAMLNGAAMDPLRTRELDGEFVTTQLDDLLAGSLGEVRRALATCAAVRSLDCAAMAAALGDEPDGKAEDLRRLLISRLWTVPGTDRLRPWLRRLLLEELASRGTKDSDSWWRVHSRLRHHYLTAGAYLTTGAYLTAGKADEIGRYHHDVALGRYRAVAKDLARSLEKPESGVVTLLRTITADHLRLQPPCAPGFPGPAKPRVRAATDRRVLVLTRLLTALHVENDPLRVRWPLLADVADICAELSQLFASQADAFRQLAREYRDRADELRRITG